MTFDFRVVEVRSALKGFSGRGVQTEPTCFLKILKKHTMEVSALAFAMDLSLTLFENLGKTVHVDTYIMQHLGPGPDWSGDEQAESEDPNGIRPHGSDACGILRFLKQIQ